MKIKRAEMDAANRLTIADIPTDTFSDSEWHNIAIMNHEAKEFYYRSAKDYRARAESAEAEIDLLRLMLLQMKEAQ